MQQHKSRLVFDPTYPVIDEDCFELQDWRHVYVNVSYGIMSNTPKFLRKGLFMKAYCDSDHLGEKFTCQYRSRFFVILNMAPICWFSKKQTSLETSTFGSDFVAMNQ